jgi:hypothetical protein
MPAIPNAPDTPYSCTRDNVSILRFIGTSTKHFLSQNY